MEREREREKERERDGWIDYCSGPNRQWKHVYVAAIDDLVSCQVTHYSV